MVEYKHFLFSAILQMQICINLFKIQFCLSVNWFKNRTQEFVWDITKHERYFTLFKKANDITIFIRTLKNVSANVHLPLVIQYLRAWFPFDAAIETTLLQKCYFVASWQSSTYHSYTTTSLHLNNILQNTLKNFATLKPYVTLTVIDTSRFSLWSSLE